MNLGQVHVSDPLVLSTSPVSRCSFAAGTQTHESHTFQNGMHSQRSREGKGFLCPHVYNKAISPTYSISEAQSRISIQMTEHLGHRKADCGNSFE